MGSPSRCGPTCPPCTSRSPQQPCRRPPHCSCGSPRRCPPCCPCCPPCCPPCCAHPSLHYLSGQLPVSVHHHVKVAEPAEVAAVEEAIAEEEVAADPVEAVDLRTPEKKEEPVVTTFVHAAPVVHHSAPVHHAVHHAAPVVHHAVH